MTRKNTAEPAPLTADQVRRKHDSLGDLLTLLPELGLAQKDRSRLGGYLFLRGPDLVLEVHAALNGPGEPSAERRAVAKGIYDRLRRGCNLRNLQDLLAAAARRAGDLALYDHSIAIMEAVEVVQEARRDVAAGVPGSPERLRRLQRALRLLEKKQARATRGVRHAHKERAAAARQRKNLHNVG